MIPTCTYSKYGGGQKNNFWLGQNYGLGTILDGVFFLAYN